MLLHSVALGTVRLDGVGQQLLQVLAALRAWALVHQAANVRVEQPVAAENGIDVQGFRG